MKTTDLQWSTLRYRPDAILSLGIQRLGPLTYVQVVARCGLGNRWVYTCLFISAPCGEMRFVSATCRAGDGTRDRPIEPEMVLGNVMDLAFTMTWDVG